eukprot:COSAG02_NODE_321_length_24780_cov_11.623962_23_plen_71_part_00
MNPSNTRLVISTGHKHDLPFSSKLDSGLANCPVHNANLYVDHPGRWGATGFSLFSLQLKRKLSSRSRYAA